MMKKANFNKVQRILIFILFTNIIVAILKIVSGTIVKSASMTADGFHSISDGSSNIVGLIGIQLAAKPVDREHPYGHNKYETLAGLFISVMLFLAGGKVFINAIERFVKPMEPDISIESLIVLILTLVINIFVSFLEYKKGKELNSQILISDSMHTRSDIYVSTGVLTTLICVKAGLPAVIDPIVSLAVGGFIFHGAYEIFKTNSDVLVDRSAVNTDEIRSIVMSFEDVKDAHKIRSRGNMNDLNIDLHILVDSKLDVEKSHKLVHDIEKTIKDKYHENSQVIVHVEPYNEAEIFNEM